MISIVYDSGKYRKLLSEIVREGDVVVEIGPHLGHSTEKYVAKTELTIALDIGEQSEKRFAELERQYENLRFIRGDTRRFEVVKKVIDITKRCDVLAVDIGGGRYPDTAFKVWAVWSGVFRPRDSVIRNRGLAEFVQRAKVADESVKKDFEDAGWLAEWGRTIPSKLRDQLDEFDFWVKRS